MTAEPIPQTFVGFFIETEPDIEDPFEDGTDFDRPPELALVTSSDDSSDSSDSDHFYFFNVNIWLTLLQNLLEKKFMMNLIPKVLMVTHTRFLLITRTRLRLLLASMSKLLTSLLISRLQPQFSNPWL